MKDQKFTRKQIEEAIKHWESVLESMNEDEVLDEGFFKKAKDKIKDKAAAAKKGLKDAAAGAAEKLHDAFAANEGMKMLGMTMGKAKKEGKKEEDLKFALNLPPDFKGNVAGFAIYKKNKLVLQFSEKDDVKLGPAELKQFLKEKGIEKNVTSSIDGIVCCISEKDKEADSDKFEEFSQELNIEGDTVFMFPAKVKKIALNNDVIDVSFFATESQQKKKDAEDHFWD